MNNVISLTRVQQPDLLVPADNASPLMFHAYERPLWYEGKTGSKYDNTSHKALVRMKDDKPVCLNVVSDTYKVVQNEELFNTIHTGLTSGLSQQEIASARIVDKIAYGGAQCLRQYVFPDISFASPERDKIAFRIVIQNGFGSGAIKLYAGAIDFFCSNGLIIGEFTSTYAKHTKGLSLTKFEDAVRGAVHMFWKNKDMFDGLAKRKIYDSNTVRAWLEQRFGERLGTKLFRQYVIESETRGRTLWALYSALTYYASHSEGEFSLRNTANDHAAATMIRRENEVRKATHDLDEFMKLAA